MSQTEMAALRFAAREFGQWGRADGAIERRFESGLPAGQRRGAARLQDAIAERLRQMDGNAGLPESEIDLHQRHRTTGRLIEAPAAFDL